MLPIFDVISERINQEELKKLIAVDCIRTIPLAFLRGMTLKYSFIIADEMQNTKPEQMRLLLTRLGDKSKMVITGDIEQSDICGVNGLADAINRLQGINRVAVIKLTEQSIIRHPIIGEIDSRYKA